MLNIDNIGVVELSKSEEFDFVGGWSITEYIGASLVGAGTGAVYGAFFGPGVVISAAVGSLAGGVGYTLGEVYDYYTSE